MSPDNNTEPEFGSRYDGGPVLARDEDARAKLDIVKIRLRLSKAGVSEDRHDAILDDLQSIMDAYMVYRLRQQSGVTPNQVLEHAEKIEREAEKLSALVLPDWLKAEFPLAWAVRDLVERHGNAKQRAALEALVGALWNDHLTSALELAKRKLATTSRREISGKVERSRRQHHFAAGLRLLLTSKHGLPDDLRANGLLCQLLRECLKAAGEDQTNARRVFANAPDVVDLSVLMDAGQFSPIVRFELSRIPCSATE